MGLRCLLGHDFGDSEIEREREEDGNEMVVTIREVEACRRCGAERIISENKEVTSIRTAEEIGLETDEDDATAVPPDQADDATSESADESDPAAGSTDSADTADAEATASAESTGEAAADVEDAEQFDDSGAEGTEEFADPDADDGVILPEDSPERGHGEWPETEQEDQPDKDSPDTAGPDSRARSSGGTANQDEATRQSTDIDATAATASDDQAESETADQTDERPSVADGEDDDVEILDADDDSDTADSAGSDAAESEPTASESSVDATDTATGDASATDEADQLSAEEGAAAWPDHGGEDEGFDAEIASEEDVSFSGNSLTPDVEADAPAPDAEYVETDADTGRDSTDRVAESTRQTDVDTGIAREGSATVDLSEVGDDTEFYCPNCGITRESGNSSMRPGDICPECRKGYIAER